MQQTFSQKYRPKQWQELVGQKHIKLTLQNEIISGNIASAYLLCGPRGIGKTTIARLFSKSINCLERDKKSAEPCGKCQACQLQLENKALDVVEIDAASNTGVDNVRENIINNARVAPSSLKYKVFIIDEVHMLSLSAFNALLKTLEEPPQNTIFILATTEAHKVPATIISRCQRFDLRIPNIEEIADRLVEIAGFEKFKLPLDAALAIARFSEGHIRDAESALGQVTALSDDGNITLELVDLVIPRSDANLFVKLFAILVDKQTALGFEFIQKLVTDGVDLLEFNKAFIDFLRKAMLYQVGQTNELLISYQFDKEVKKDLLKKIESISLLRLQKMIELFISKFQEMKYASISQLPLELAVVELTVTEDEDENQDKKPPITPVDKEKIVVDKKPEIAPVEASTIEVKRDLPVNTDCQMTIEQIHDNWKKIIKEVKGENHALALTLKICKVLACKQGQIVLGFKYKFYQDRVLDKKNKDLLENVFARVLGERLQLVCEVGNFEIETEKTIQVEDGPQEDNNNDETVNIALEAFGGKIV